MNSNLAPVQESSTGYQNQWANQSGNLGPLSKMSRFIRGAVVTVTGPQLTTIVAVAMIISNCDTNRRGVRQRRAG